MMWQTGALSQILFVDSRLVFQVLDGHGHSALYFHFLCWSLCCKSCIHYKKCFAFMRVWFLAVRNLGCKNRDIQTRWDLCSLLAVFNSSFNSHLFRQTLMKWNVVIVKDKLNDDEDKIIYWNVAVSDTMRLGLHDTINTTGLLQKQKINLLKLLIVKSKHENYVLNWVVLPSGHWYGMY